VKFAGCGPALESQVFEKRAAQPHPGRTRGKRAAPLTPLFAVEFFESRLSFVLLFLLARGEDFEQRLSWRIVRGDCVRMDSSFG